jgi:hypothetical protein
MEGAFFRPLEVANRGGKRPILNRFRWPLPGLLIFICRAGKNLAAGSLFGTRNCLSAI